MPLGDFSSTSLVADESFSTPVEPAEDLFAAIQ
jgi:hypothetical protein